MYIERKSYINKKRAFEFSICFFFLMRIFTPEFISNNTFINSVYVLISQLLTIWCVLRFLYGIGQSQHCYLYEISLILVIASYLIYLLIITFFKAGNIQRIFMIGYPIVGTVLFIHNNVKKNYYELIKGISWLLTFFAVANFIDMVFVKHVLSSNVAVFMVGGRNQLAIFLSITVCFYFAQNIEENKKIKIQIKDVAFIALILFTTLLSKSITCLITIGMFFLLFFIYEFQGKKTILNIKIITVGYIVVWFAIIVFRMQYLFSDIITNVFHKDLTFSHRTIIWDQALKDICKNPIFGHGMTDSVNIFWVNHDYTGNNNYVWSNMSAHNEFLQLLYYGGIILLLFFALIYFIAVNKRGNRNKLFYLFFIGIMAIAVNWLSEVPGEYAMLFLLMMCFYSKCIKQSDSWKMQ